MKWSSETVRAISTWSAAVSGRTGSSSSAGDGATVSGAPWRTGAALGAVATGADAARAGFCRVGLAALAAWWLGGCTPALDWRETRPEGARVSVLLPCKPSAQERKVQLAGQTVRMQLHACAAAGMTWGLAVAEVTDPARIEAALRELSASAVGNLQAGSSEALPLVVAGATPNPAAGRRAFDGRLPDGMSVQAQSAVFADGMRVIQATVLGRALNPEAAQTFMESLKVVP